MTHFLLFWMVESKIREMFHSKAVRLGCRAECRGLLAALTALAPIYPSSIELSTHILYTTAWSGWPIASPTRQIHAQALNTPSSTRYLTRCQICPHFMDILSFDRIVQGCVIFIHSLNGELHVDLVIRRIIALHKRRRFYLDTFISQKIFQYLYVGEISHILFCS